MKENDFPKLVEALMSDDIKKVRKGLALAVDIITNLAQALVEERRKQTEEEEKLELF